MCFGKRNLCCPWTPETLAPCKKKGMIEHYLHWWHNGSHFNRMSCMFLIWNKSRAMQVFFSFCIPISSFFKQPPWCYGIQKHRSLLENVTIIMVYVTATSFISWASFLCNHVLFVMLAWMWIPLSCRCHRVEIQIRAAGYSKYLIAAGKLVKTSVFKPM